MHVYLRAANHFYVMYTVNRISFKMLVDSRWTAYMSITIVRIFKWFTFFENIKTSMTFKVTSAYAMETFFILIFIMFVCTSALSNYHLKGVNCHKLYKRDFV